MSVSLGGLVETAFATLAGTVQGAVKTITYESVGAQTYNATTGAMVNTVTTYIDVAVVFTDYSRREKESDFLSSRRQTIEFGDRKCLIAYTNLPITVSMEDIIIENGQRWRIVNYSIDPTGMALHIFQLRLA